MMTNDERLTLGLSFQNIAEVRNNDCDPEFVSGLLVSGWTNCVNVESLVSNGLRQKKEMFPSAYKILINV